MRVNLLRIGLRVAVRDFNNHIFQPVPAAAAAAALQPLSIRRQRTLTHTARIFDVIDIPLGVGGNECLFFFN